MVWWTEFTLWIRELWYDFRHAPFPVEWSTFIYWKEDGMVQATTTFSPIKYAKRHKLENWSTDIKDVVNPD